MTIPTLKTAAGKLPHQPGIYIFKDAENKPLYIGKALDLKNRVKNYLKTGDVRLQKMIATAKNIDYAETDSDIESLILESQYIKKCQPPFNIMLRDDKQYGFIGFTEEKYPKLFITHQPHSKYRDIEISSFIGPFTDVGALKTTLRYLRRIFPYCTCKKPHNNFCLNYHIGKCYGFCCLKNPVSSIKYQALRDYGKNIKAIRGVLTGRKTSVIKGLEKEMLKLGKKGKLEEAIELRDKLEKLKRVFENARIIHNTKYLIHNTESGIKSQNALKELARLLKLSHVPNRIEAYDVANIQGKYAVGAMVVFSLRQGSEQVNWKPDKSEYRKFRIRNLQNTNHKTQITNKFQIQNYKFKTGGDVRMLKEILIRRFRHHEWPIPDLIVVDGGKAQLSATLRTINNLQLTTNNLPTLVALTKNKKHKGEKIYVARPSKGGFAFSEKKPIPLSQLPISVKNLLLHIDSEAHRFAISYYRKLHIKSLS